MTTALPNHPGLTFRVYRVDPITGKRTPVRQRTAVAAATEPLATSVWPPCRCPLCARGAA
jgi:hypothetical protein